MKVEKKGMNKEKKFQKKVLKLINAVNKCSIDDLELFVALCLIRFENEDVKKYGCLGHHRMEVSTHFSVACELSTELNKDNNIHKLLY